MSSKDKKEFRKDNIDMYLKEVANAYRKKVGKKMPAEIILIGGASVIINYGFREMTTDIDALIFAASAMNDAIIDVTDRFELPYGWLNQDFKNTDSYSSKIVQYSEYYRTYSNVLTVRTVSAEYLIAMKLRSGRQYKNDLSDILGVLETRKRMGHPISLNQIQEAVIRLYDDWNKISKASQQFIYDAFKDGDYTKLYFETLEYEKRNKKELVAFDKYYPGVLKQTNIDEIVDDLNKKSIIERLREKKEQINREQVKPRTDQPCKSRDDDFSL